MSVIRLMNVLALAFCSLILTPAVAISLQAKAESGSHASVKARSQLRSKVAAQLRNFATVAGTSAGSIVEESETEIEDRGNDNTLYSGDVIHLYAASLLRVDVSGGRALGRSSEAPGVPGIVVELDGGEDAQGAEIRCGDPVLLRSRHSTQFISHSGQLVPATTPHKLVQFTIHRVDGKDVPLAAKDPFFLKIASGEALFIDEASGELILRKGEPTAQNMFTFDHVAYGALHDIVGEDGVLMISLQQKSSEKRRDNSMSELGSQNIYPMAFPATDANKAPKAALELSCPLESQSSTSWCSQMGRKGSGCKTELEQAMTDSHRRALVAAMWRQDSDWTAIIEDDAVPVRSAHGTDWSQSFKKQWAQLPKEALIVRLGSCSFESDVGQVFTEFENTPTSWQPDEFQLVRRRWFSDASGNHHYYPGGCTTGYLVHKSIIPEMLQIFPCCSSFDSCLERQLFYAKAADTFETSDGEFGRYWGARHLVDMQHSNARAYSQTFTNFNQSGILVQDHRHDDDEMQSKRRGKHRKQPPRTVDQ